MTANAQRVSRPQLPTRVPTIVGGWADVRYWESGVDALSVHPSLVQVEEFQDLVNDRGDRAGGRNGDDPGPDDLRGHAPANCRQTLCRADTDDRAGDRMRRADGDAEVRRGENRHRGPRFGGETADRLQFGDF